MGILNVTPDSFSDGGRFLAPEAAIARAQQMIKEGADILDIGAESTRPNAEPVPADRELARLLPVIEALGGIGVPLSIDTSKPEVAAACLAAGARIINDVTGLRHPEMAPTIARHNAACVIMHMRGTPQTMDSQTSYGDVVAEVLSFLSERVALARASGISDLAIDPGIGFAKQIHHNFEILRRFAEFNALGLPVVAGPSRKRFLGTLADMEPVENRVDGTVAAVTIAVLNGAKVIRVHDIAPARRAIAVAQAVRNS
jgi:dihydropteroate synthase